MCGLPSIPYSSVYWRLYKVNNEHNAMSVKLGLESHCKVNNEHKAMGRNHLLALICNVKEHKAMKIKYRLASICKVNKEIRQ